MKRLTKQMLHCNLCALREGCRQVVPGEGSAEAEVMFIGEGPGAKEDELGRPFVGAAGKFLDEMLAEVGLKREDVYIANMVKCRPPANRDPLPEEKKTCWPWLEKQISIIRPKLIVTLGRHSMEKFFPQAKISRDHGRALRREIEIFDDSLQGRIKIKQAFFILYHPAAALYNGGMREVLLADFKNIPKVLRAIGN